MLARMSAIDGACACVKDAKPNKQIATSERTIFFIVILH
ncbi:hypothetical protein CAter282_1783 [Collimonas arenae]|uniref:Uncharacterized protein n=1 Tax=Collimonas arenae TaxID=279058 RepID=A0A127PQL0_9BURK|nr:hypothetical protein CAter10_1922 [Collimonas arenae]AMP09559.1 hypothetical protein CAter282_1783 [Collimonas arenae]